MVRHRLGEIGLLPYALDLHDHNARPAEVRARLKTALAQRVRPDLDGYKAALGEVEGSASGLRTYAERLHRPNRAGLSLWSAHATMLARGSGPALTVPPAVLAEECRMRGGLAQDQLRRLIGGAIGDLAALDPEVDSGPWGLVGGRYVAGRPRLRPGPARRRPGLRGSATTVDRRECGASGGRSPGSARPWRPGASDCCSGSTWRARPT